MSCPRTPHLLMAYFDETTASSLREELDRHLRQCITCSEELNSLLAVRETLTGWQEQRVPHWNRGAIGFRQEHIEHSPTRVSWLLQWLPTAASLCMLVLLLLNVSIQRDEDGFSMAFGDTARSLDRQHLDSRLSEFAVRQRQQQEQHLQQYLAAQAGLQQAGFERLRQAVLDEARQVSLDGFEQLYSYFEQQRQLDLETIQVSYQQLLDHDFETLRTMQQLAGVMQTQSPGR